MPTKLWLEVKVDNDIVMDLLLSFISRSHDFKPLFVPVEANSGYFQYLLYQYIRYIENTVGAVSIG